MSTNVRETQDLELALLRRGVDERVAGSERCGAATVRRWSARASISTSAGTMLCELCRDAEREAAGELGPRARAGVRAHDADHRPPRRVAPPRAPGGREAQAAPSDPHIQSATVDPFTVSTTISKPARGGLRVPGGHRQPRGVHRPLPDRLASDARGLLRRRARAPASGSRRRCSRFSWADVTFAEIQPPFRILERGRGGKYNRIRMVGTYTLSPGRGEQHAGRVHDRDRSGDAVGQADGDVRRAILEQAPGGQGDAPAAADPRGRTGPGPARLGRGPADGGRR